jgi:hypothetical protein
MHRISALCAAAGLGLTALAATSPAQAAFHLIRWQDNGFCQVWDQSIPTTQDRQHAGADLCGSARSQGKLAAQGYVRVLKSVRSAEGWARSRFRAVPIFFGDVRG